MPDLGKVIRGLEVCKTAPELKEECAGCPYDDGQEDCIARMAADALALLKAQEPVKAIADGEDSYMCNNCGTVIGWAEWEPGGIEEVKYKFCPECGRAVKWDEPQKGE